MYNELMWKTRAVVNMNIMAENFDRRIIFINIKKIQILCNFRPGVYMTIYIVRGSVA